jgi:hypothetical protein
MVKTGTSHGLSIFICFISLIIICVSLSFISSGQNNELQRLKADYPKVVAEFPLDKQSATYVFAIDFSTSMQPLESIVKENLRMFINTLPEGDKVTLIKEGQTNATDFIYIPNAPISAGSRQSIIQNLTNVPFNQTASDGYKLTEKIIEAIDITGGNELIYIFIFTDFEYYTSINGYNKNQCDWKKLGLKYSGIEKGKKIMKVGLELPASNLHPEAIFKTDLDKVFNGIKYYKIVDGGSLASWFADTRANILRDRLRFVVEKEIDEEKIHTKFHIRPSSGSSPETWVQPEGKLIKSFKFQSPENLLKGNRQLIEWPFGDEPTTEGEILITFNEKFQHNKGYNEIEKLVQDSQQKKVPLIIHKSKAYIAWWVALLILLFLISWMLWIMYILLKKYDRTWTISVNWKDIKGKSYNLSNTFKGKFTIGSGNELANHLPVNGATWKIKIETIKNHPVFFWKRPGYYLTILEGNLLELEYPFGGNIKTLGMSRQYFLSPPKRFRGGNLFINQEKLRFTISIT